MYEIVFVSRFIRDLEQSTCPDAPAAEPASRRPFRRGRDPARAAIARGVAMARGQRYSQLHRAFRAALGCCPRAFFARVRSGMESAVEPEAPCSDARGRLTASTRTP